MNAQDIKRAAKPALAVFIDGPIDSTFIRVENADKVRVVPSDKVQNGAKLMSVYKLHRVTSERVLFYKFKGFAEAKQAVKAGAFITKI